MDKLIDCRLDADGILLATIDMPDRSMNVFSAALMDALEAVMDRVDADAAVRAVLLTSGKPSFLAGADLIMVRGFTDSARTLDDTALFDLCGRLGRLFVRLEASAKPWVAAVNGLALGGGLELAMACRARLVADDAALRVGLPEVRWGLLPGAGGTQRLPRLCGFETALAMLLSGRAIAPAEAVERGLFEQAVPRELLLGRARERALQLAGTAYDASVKFGHAAQTDVPWPAPGLSAEIARQYGISDADFRDYPAHEAIIDCVLLGARKPLAEASAIEMQQFLRLMRDPVAGNMVRSLFINRQRADRELAAPADLRIARITFGPVSPESAGWTEALARSRIELAEDGQLARDTAVLEDNRGNRTPVRLATLDHIVAPVDGVVAEAVLSPAGAYGRVLEIISAPAPQAEALAALAARLGALPYRSGDAASVLRRLAGADSLDAQALTALRLLHAGAAPDPETLDVAACAATLTPAFAGGPVAYLWSQRERLAAGFDAGDRAAWAGLEPQLARLNA